MAQIIFPGTGTGSTQRQGNSASGNYSTVAGGINNQARCVFSTVGGGTGSTVFSSGATIGGGQCNTIGETGPMASKDRKTSPNSTILGGFNNKMVFGGCSFIGGGCQNYVDGFNNTIIGGQKNTTYEKVCESSIGGGFSNTTFNSWTTIGGGRFNSARGIYSTIVGGSGNTTNSNFNMIGSGRNQKAIGTYGFIGGGCNNLTNGDYSVAGGGFSNTANANQSVIGGGNLNTITTDSCTASIIGGTCNTISSSELSFVGGGFNNSILNYAGVIGGGRSNTVTGFGSGVLAGRLNKVTGANSNILGGILNTVSGNYSIALSTNSYVTGDRSVVVGGQNLAGTSDDTVYVPFLNIRDLGLNAAVTNIGVDIDGNVVPGQNSSGNFAVDGILVEGVPSVLGPVLPDPNALSTTNLINGVGQSTTTIIYDDFGTSYNTLNGIWTCPSSGRYNISYFVHLTDSVSGWQNPSTTPGSNLNSAVVAGLINPITGFIYAANNFFPSVPQLYCDINGAQWGVELNAGDQMLLVIMNTSGVFYTPSTGDYFRFSLQKVG